MTIEAIQIQGFLFALAGDIGSEIPGRGTAQDPLRIYTGQQLYDFAQCFNGGELPEGLPADGKVNLSLMNDIDLSAYASWTPIGTQANPFNGSFKSDGSAKYTITGLTINETVNITSDVYYGLFGYIGYDSGSRIERIGIDAHINVTNQGSGLVYAGGLVGNSNTAIENCYVTGSVSAASGKSVIIGGLVGGFGESATIENCYSFASVNAYSSGGLMAIIMTGSLAGIVITITNSYATGNVSVSTAGTQQIFVGGLTGQGSVRNSTALARDVLAEATGGGNAYSNRIVATVPISPVNNYAWDGMTVNDSIVTTGTGSNGNGADATATELATATPWTEFTQANGWEYTPGSLPILKNVGGNQSSTMPAWITTTPAPNTTYIYTAQDLKALADKVKSGDRFLGKTVLLMNDIDLGMYANWTPIGMYKGTVNYTDESFKGTFKSDGTATHKITGLRIKDTIDLSSGQHSSYGLFGFAGEGSKIERIGVEADIDVTNLGTGYVYAGGLVGVGYKSTVANSYAAENVDATNQEFASIGGLAGRVRDDSSTIAGSHASANVSTNGAWCQAGGLAGDTEGSIENSYATGSVYIDPTANSNSAVGGLIATNSAIVKNCYATGSVRLNANSSGLIVFAGGLVGRCEGEEITSSYATGNVAAENTSTEAVIYAGGLVGDANAIIQYNVALGRSVWANSANGTTYIGRVTGTDSKPTLTNNHALEGMKVNNAIIGDTDPDSGSDKIHGANVTGTQLLSAAWWKNTAQFGDTDWDMADERLPLLINPKGEAQRPIWLMAYPSAATQLQLTTNGAQVYKQGSGVKTITVMVSGHENVNPNRIKFTGAALTPTGNPNEYTFDLDTATVGTTTIEAHLTHWRDIEAPPLVLIVNGDLGQAPKTTMISWSRRR